MPIDDFSLHKDTNGLDFVEGLFYSREELEEASTAPPSPVKDPDPHESDGTLELVMQLLQMIEDSSNNRTSPRMANPNTVGGSMGMGDFSGAKQDDGMDDTSSFLPSDLFDDMFSASDEHVPESAKPIRTKSNRPAPPVFPLHSSSELTTYASELNPVPILWIEPPTVSEVALPAPTNAEIPSVVVDVPTLPPKPWTNIPAAVYQPMEDLTSWDTDDIPVGSDDHGLVPWDPEGSVPLEGLEDEPEIELRQPKKQSTMVLLAPTTCSVRGPVTRSRSASVCSSSDSFYGDCEIRTIPSVVRTFRRPPTALERSIQAIFASSLGEVGLSGSEKVNRAIEWGIAGFSVLIGCDIVLVDVGVVYVKSFVPPSWLAGFSSNIPLLELPVEQENMLELVEKILRFLNIACRGKSGSYCLVRDGTQCQLIDVSLLGGDWGMFRPSGSLAVPIAKVSLVVAKGELEAGTTYSKNTICLLKRAREYLRQPEGIVDEQLYCEISDLLVRLCSECDPSFAAELVLEKLVGNFNEESASKAAGLMVTACGGKPLHERMQLMLCAQKILSKISTELCHSIEVAVHTKLCESLLEFCNFVRKRFGSRSVSLHTTPLLETSLNCSIRYMDKIFPGESVPIPNSIYDACKFIADDLCQAPPELRAAAMAEQGVVHMERYLSNIGANGDFLTAIDRFGSAVKHCNNEILLGQIFMGVGKLIKREVSKLPTNSIERFVLHQQAIGCVMLSMRIHKISTQSPVLDTAAFELYQMAEDFSNLIEEHDDEPCYLQLAEQVVSSEDLSVVEIRDSVDEFTEIVRTKKFPKYQPPKKKLIPNTPFELGQLTWTDKDLSKLASFQVQKILVGLLDFAVSMCDETTERIERKAMCEIFAARLFKYSDPARALKDTTNALAFLKTFPEDDAVRKRYYPETLDLRSKALVWLHREPEAIALVVDSLNNEIHDEHSRSNLRKSVNYSARMEFENHQNKRVKNIEEIRHEIAWGTVKLPVPDIIGNTMNHRCGNSGRIARR